MTEQSIQTLSFSDAETVVRKRGKGKAKRHLILRPQPGKQERFLSSPADIAFYGGQAGGGKTSGLLLQPLAHIHLPLFSAVFFRRTYPQIEEPQAAWDTSKQFYPYAKGKPNDGKKKWVFPSGAYVKFAHMQHENNMYDWQGAQLALQLWDEITQFLETQFFYLLSRLRSTCGIRPYIRATMNPDPDHFTRQLIDWWIDEEGFAIEERCGVIRYFARVGQDNELIWGDTSEELIKRYSNITPKSFTFINSSVYDNKILLDQNPEYVSNLQALPYVDRQRLLHGNWNVRPAAGDYFKKTWFRVVDAAPQCSRIIRYWDRAAGTDRTGSATAGVKMGKTLDGNYVVFDSNRFWEAPPGVERHIKNTASQDTRDVEVWVEQDPGQAGKMEAQYYIRLLAGYIVRANVVREAKGVRAKPFSSQCEAGNVCLVRGAWNEAYLNELESFTGAGSAKEICDQVDASSGAFAMLSIPKKRAGVI